MCEAQEHNKEIFFKKKKRLPKLVSLSLFSSILKSSFTFSSSYNLCSSNEVQKISALNFLKIAGNSGRSQNAFILEHFSALQFNWQTILCAFMLSLAARLTKLVVTCEPESRAWAAERTRAHNII